MAKAKTPRAELFHVHCALRNASHQINGVSFGPHDGETVRTVELVEASVADQFDGIPGYKITPFGAPPVVPVVDPPETPNPESGDPSADADAGEGDDADSAPAAPPPVDPANSELNF